MGGSATMFQATGLVTLGRLMGIGLAMKNDHDRSSGHRGKEHQVQGETGDAMPLEADTMAFLEEFRFIRKAIVNEPLIAGITPQNRLLIRMEAVKDPTAGRAIIQHYG